MQQLLAALLERNPEKRLGLGVCDHPWLSDSFTAVAGARRANTEPSLTGGGGRRPHQLLTRWDSAAVLVGSTPLANRQEAAIRTREIRLRRVMTERGNTSLRASAFDLLAVDASACYSSPSFRRGESQGAGSLRSSMPMLRRGPLSEEPTPHADGILSLAREIQ